MAKAKLKLKEEDHHYLEELLAKGTLPARTYKRAVGLMELHRGKSQVEIAATLSVSRMTVSRWHDNYLKNGISCLEELPRSGRPIEIDGKARAKITALACTKAPKGYARWNLRLLASKVVELGYCNEISHTQVGKILKKTKSSRI